MCTVTFFKKSSNDFVLTSNRDEAPFRLSSAPQIYSLNNTNALFPKDEVAGGTWIGTSEKNRTLCVLNGGFEAHERKADYRLSRGIIVRELLIANDLFQSVKTFDLNGVEPFTLIIVLHEEQLQLFQLVWDGNKKHLSELPLEPRLWSSSSLYTKSMKEERERWFKNFIKKNSFRVDSILDFHKTAGSGNLDYGVIMDRHFVKTTSITQIEKERDKIIMNYTNLNDGTHTLQELKLKKHIER